MAWMDERVELACKLWNAGYSASEIAKRLGFSRNAVIGKLDRERSKGRFLRSWPFFSKNRFRCPKKALAIIPVHSSPPLAATEQPAPLPFEELKSHHCRFSVCEDEAGRYQFCGRAVAVRGMS